MKDVVTHSFPPLVSILHWRQRGSDDLPSSLELTPKGKDLLPEERFELPRLLFTEPQDDRISLRHIGTSLTSQITMFCLERVSETTSDTTGECIWVNLESHPRTRLRGRTQYYEERGILR